MADVRIQVFGRTDLGKARDSNEDAFVIADLGGSAPVHSMPMPIALQVEGGGVLLAVSDGMGGARAGAVASAVTLHALRRGMCDGVGGTAEAALQASVETANQRVWDASSVDGRRGMGATLTAVLIHGGCAHVAEVGDSRAYLLRGNRFVQLTHDESTAQLALDLGALTREDAETFSHKNVIMHAIGAKPSVVVALNRVSLRRRDRILLCSDGLSGVVSDDEMHAVVHAASTLDAACATLIDLANARGGEDNITVLLAEMDGEGLPALTGDEQLSATPVQALAG